LELLVEALLDGGLDTLKMLPFLLAAFLFLEFLEHKSEGRRDRFLSGIGAAGPAVGALFGCVPQCGFSVAAANLYAGGVITAGTLLAVFLSTSDEAILLLMGHPGQAGTVFKLLGVKVLLGLFWGYGVDLLLAKSDMKRNRLGAICDECGCNKDGIEMPFNVLGKGYDPDAPGRENLGEGTARRGEVLEESNAEGQAFGEGHHTILRAALYHTLEIFIYLFSVNVLLNILLGAVGIEWLSGVLLKDSFFQPVLAAFIGLIPNCAASVVLTELYLSGALSFGAAVAGLLSGAGVGLAVLFRINRDKRENLRVTGMLLFAAVFSGIILQIVLKF
jgi:hypothetical protein